MSADLFEPKHAIIIQNKDELKIPLLLETIPTPKEFKDAIASLSPEQQRFCKAFRSMQLGMLFNINSWIIINEFCREYFIWSMCYSNKAST